MTRDSVEQTLIQPECHTESDRQTPSQARISIGKLWELESKGNHDSMMITLASLRNLKTRTGALPPNHRAAPAQPGYRTMSVPLVPRHETSGVWRPNLVYEIIKIVLLESKSDTT